MRASVKGVFTPNGGAVPEVRRLPSRNACTISLAGSPFDELTLNITDLQARAIRDKLCLAYGLPEDAKQAIRLAEDPPKPMPLDKLPQTALALCAYITWDWRTTDDLATSYPDTPRHILPGLLHMLENARLIESKEVENTAHPYMNQKTRAWRKRVIALKELSPEGRKLLPALSVDTTKDLFTLHRETGLTKGVARSCLTQMITGGLVVTGDIPGSSALGYRRREPHA